MRIPSSFQMMAHRIRIKAVPASKWKHKDCVGYYDYENQLIKLKDGPGTMPGHILCHEVLHACLTAMGHKLNGDEAFVDNLSGLLWQAMSTAKYPRQPRRSRKTTNGHRKV